VAYEDGVECPAGSTDASGCMIAVRGDAAVHEGLVA
jgi:hypothetical protein